MPTATIKVFEHWSVITAEVRKEAKKGLDVAAGVGLATIEGIWPHGGMHRIGSHPTTSGFASGVSADPAKRHIAHFHDHGTLGHFRRGARTEPKRPRKRQYKMTREDGSPTGIVAKRFYAKGRNEGRKALLRSLGL